MDRVTWDAPLHSLDDVKEMAIKAINSKPSRFGSLEELLAIYEHCEREGIAIYGGGQGEVECGRGQIQYLASLFHPDTPNDTAPSGFNDPAVPKGMPSSPMDPLPSATGFRWADEAPISRARMIDDRSFIAALRAQVGNEFAASQQYIAAAVYYDAETLPRLADFFYKQAVEERNHALMIVQYLMDAGEEAPIPGVERAVERVRRRRRPGRDGARPGEGGLRPDRQPRPAGARGGRLPGRAVHAVVHQGADRGGRVDERPAEGRRAGARQPAARRGVPGPRVDRRRGGDDPTAPRAAGGAL